MARLKVFVLVISALSLLNACDTELAPSSSKASFKIVGSETVFPYAAAVAEMFSEIEKAPLPVLEAVGTGAGVQLFCRGALPPFPSVLMASRAFTPKDYALCQKNGVQPADILEILIGFEGLVLVQSLEAPPLKLRTTDLYKALSNDPTQRLHNWHDISSHLPVMPIKILGPSRMSGSYETLLDLTLRPFCPSKNSTCLQIRSDGLYMEMGSNQNVLIEKIIQNPKAVGIISFAFFKKNQHRLRGIPLDGALPSFENCFNRTYPFLRPLYIYVKKSHMKLFPKLEAYLKHFFTREALNTHSLFSGYLIEKGLIPLTPNERPFFTSSLSSPTLTREKKSDSQL